MGIATSGKIDLEKKVTKVIDEALELAYLGGRRPAAHKIAERVFDSEPKLMQEVFRLWAIERLTWMMNRRRRELWHDRLPEQMVLPDPIFRDLPQSVFLHNGRRPKLDDCKLPEIRDHLRLLRERYSHHARIAQMEAVVELHEKWAAVSRNITWADAKRREAEERAR